HLHPLRREVWKVKEYASDVAPWPRKGSCHTAGDRVRFKIDCDNRNGARGQSSRVQYQGAARHDHAQILSNDFGYQRSNLRRVTSRRSGHNLDLGGSGVAGNPQAAQNCFDAKSHRRLRALIYKTDSRDFRGLLRSRTKRPSDRCHANKRDELAPPHSITSSALVISDCGIARPSALAVLRLMTRSNLVGCSTGRSAGGVPFATPSP